MKEITKITKTNHKLNAGHNAEELACQLLISRGYEILDRNVRYKMGEIDIIARDKSILCFIEVRSRSNTSFLSPKASIETKKQQKLIRAAQLYLQKKYFRNKPLCRFDAVSVIGYGPDKKIELIKKAFELSLQPARKSGSPWQRY